MKIRRLDFPIAKAVYLLNYTTELGVGGDKRKFWREIMGFSTPEHLRETLLAGVTANDLQYREQNPYGDLYEAIISVEGPSGSGWKVQTGWIVLFGEDIARFVTAYPA